MPHLIMIYGSHGDNDFQYIQPILDKEIKRLKKIDGDILAIMEYNGPINTFFRNISTKLINLGPESIFNLITEGQNEAFKYYEQTGNAIYSKRYNNFNINFQLRSLFIKSFIDFLSDRDIDIKFQKPNYDDWLKIRPYLKDYPCRLPECLRTYSYCKNLSDTESSFRQQIEQEMHDDSKISFVIFRGLFHIFYYPCIRKNFCKHYSIHIRKYCNPFETIKDIFIV